MKKILVLITVISLGLVVSIKNYAQETPDSASTLDYRQSSAEPDEDILDEDSPLNQDTPEAKKMDEIDWDNLGVSVSPSSIHLAVTPGTSQQREITVKNVTRKKYAFRVDFNDFEMTPQGKPGPANPENSKYALSKYIGVNPSYFELEEGEEMKVRITINIPDEEDSYTAKWTIVAIEQVVERPPLDPGDQPNRLAMGILNTFGFGIYVYQNPPNVILNQIDITQLEYDKSRNTITMQTKNTGDGISYCRSYLELTNLNTGEMTRLQDKNFTILPQFNRIFTYDLPRTLTPGNYSAIGVVDYGSREEILAAEIEFEL